MHHLVMANNSVIKLCDSILALSSFFFVNSVMAVLLRLLRLNFDIKEHLPIYVLTDIIKSNTGLLALSSCSGAYSSHVYVEYMFFVQS